MEVVAAPPSGGGVPPFHDHDVREWSRLDSLTGVLERARLETDNWTANTNNSKHKYNKVVDSRARTDADGALQAQARRQLEVFQTQVPGGHLQVIKTHTVTSSRWSSSNKGNIAATTLVNGDSGGGVAKDFENLQLSLNPLDLSSEKSKASVGRSASRRPPTRQRIRPDSTTTSHNPLRNAHLTAATNLHRVSRLCHQIHETAVRQAFGGGSRSPKPPIDERQSGDGSVEIYEIESVSSNDTRSLNGHTNLSRTKSTSSEDILLLTPEKDSGTKSIEDLEDLEQLQNWRRTSKIRRSLQFPKQNKSQVAKPLDLPENSVSVRKIREDLEKGRRLNTALRGNNIDLEALDQILQSISSSSSIISDKAIDDNIEDDEVKLITSKKKEKRNSFVTVESLQEVRGRLRRTSSPSSDIYSNKDEEIDDGIVTEDKPTAEMSNNDKSAPSRVRSYVFGMEAMLNKKPMLGTGSLESRSKLVNGNSNNRSEDWYNRRKSYGFEKVHSHEESTNSISNKSKTFVESSTDSGICRSTEIVVVPTVPKRNYLDDDNTEVHTDNESKSFVSIDSVKQNGIHYGNVKKMTNLFNKDEALIGNNWSKRSSYNGSDWKPKSTTITIPIVTNSTNNSWDEEPEKDIKRHSIAVDDTKYASKNLDSKFRRTSLAINDITRDDDENNALNRKTKKVEFCKTEVHFAADSGKVNIVETDEKPPPTNNFRRRRRNSGPLVPMNEDYNRNGLPVLHFGDTSFEKSMFGVSDDDNGTEKIPDNIYENLQSRIPPAFGVVTVNTSSNHIDYQTEKKDLIENENIRGILKNKPIKPKPYHLGETIPFSDTNSDEESKKWGVRLRPVKKEEAPIWKSTVSVHNSIYDKSDMESSYENPEYQHLLKNLRPTRKDSDSENNYSDGYSGVKVVPAVRDTRRPSWSVTDKQVEELQNGESKGYSTKVNFGNGEATVIESDSYLDNNRHPTWPRADNPKDSRQLLNKGLVVRIGRNDSASNHMVCSKMTTTQDRNNTTTTTKITIDLSPSPPVCRQDNAPVFSYAKYQRSQNHSFKSTSLILNTIKDNETESSNKIPQQLEALKKLYDDVQSDSDADKEVQQLMSQISEKELNTIDNDTSSVVSGSWSKISAYKHINNFASAKSSSRYDLKHNTMIEKDSTVHVSKPAQDTNNKNADLPPSKYNVNLSRHKFSPIVIRKAAPTIRPELRSAMPAEKLSSPSLVGKNTNGYDYAEKLKPERQSPTKHITNGRQSPTKSPGRRSPVKPLMNGRASPTKPVTNGRLSPVKTMVNGKASPTKELKTVSDNKLQTKHGVVLRQPRKSEMTYFGVNISPKPLKKVSDPVIRKESKLSEKPDLLQHYNKSSESPNKIIKPRRKSPEVKKESSPIYENVNSIKNGKYSNSKQFDNAILDELTKAADQILQAVNGYTDEDAHNRLTSDDENTSKQLDTISETKSWKQDVQSSNKSKPPNTKTKLKHTSSTSSIESVSKERRRNVTVPERRQSPTKTPPSSQQRKKVSDSTTTTKSITKARRLQRASSREALLQSHGSSSEDLSTAVETPVRKPRLIKKTKAAQLTITNGLEISKKSSSHKKKEESRVEERILSSLPEIRHKTAVSTIRSTAEKSTSSRDRSRHKSEDVKKKSPQKREVLKGANQSSSRTESRSRTSASSNKETVTTHRTSTANIKKCHRSEGGTRH